MEEGRGSSNIALVKRNINTMRGGINNVNKNSKNKSDSKRKTSKKKFKQKLQEFKVWIKDNRNRPLSEIMETIKRKLIGHYNYYGITDNSVMISRYMHEIEKLLFKWLNRRSQKKSYEWESFKQMLKVFELLIPKIKVNIYAI